MSNFDPAYGYTPTQLLQIPLQEKPQDFDSFWKARYYRAIELDPCQRLRPNGYNHPKFECHDLFYRSTNDFEIGGWVLIPKYEPVARAVIVGHGYGGRENPDFDLPVTNAAFLFPCFRGLSRSKHPPISENPSFHVLHDIDKRDSYILGGCVEDLWMAVSALLNLFPSARGHVGYMGISFGGGIGALALPWENRIQRAHFNVPSFGNHPLRLQLPTWGSAASVQNYAKAHGNILATLNYYDAAIAAQCIQIPVHVAAALADPVVAPPGQFSIYNALPSEKKLFVLEKGHSDYPGKAAQEKNLLTELQPFFSNL